MVSETTTYRAFTRDTINKLPQFSKLPPSLQRDVKVVSAVFPFRTNRYVTDQLINWDEVPNDPMYQLTFPQRQMLSRRNYERVAALVDADDKTQLRAVTRQIQMAHNPHPAGQKQYNVPTLNGEPLPGLQHKYPETVLFFPSQGQTCHAYCTYCFRWAQFIGVGDLKFAGREAHTLVAYLRQHHEVTDVLFTGGDPAIMRTKMLRTYIEPLLHLSHIRNIRIGTKALSYWPYRFTTDEDADDLLRLFEAVVKSGRHVAIMAHYSHPREMETIAVRHAVQRLRDVGCEIRMQAPLMRHINANSRVWATMWREGVKQGLVPYYMFVSRDTGPRNYFEVSLYQALEIFQGAFRTISGLGRTVRGPVMSATPGKVMVNGVATIRGEKVFVLSFLQGRDPSWVGHPFFAKFNQQASWLFDLEPAFGKRFLYQDYMEQLTALPAVGD